MLPESLAPLHNRSIFFKNGKDRSSLFHTTAETSNNAFQGRPTADSYYQKSQFRRAQRFPVLKTLIFLQKIF